VIAIGATLDRDTVREYEIYGAAHWLTRWKTLGELTPQALGEYQRARLRKVTRSTLSKELSAMRGMLRWCIEQGVLAELPEIPELPRQAMGTRARGPALRRVVLTEPEVERLIRAMPKGRARDYVVFAWETGLRPATIFKLRSPAQWDGERLTITADVDKARFARELPLTERAREVIARRTPSRTGRLFSWRELVTAELHRVSERVLRRRVTLYDLRHSRITHLVEAGGPLTGVQWLAGHKHLSTTAKYTHAGPRAAQDALAALGRGPGPRMGSKRAS
jgi:integrase